MIADQDFSQGFIDQLVAGDRQAFGELVEQTSPKIYALGLRMLANEQDAEDMLQETYLKAYKALPNFEKRSSISTWLFRIAVNEALMLLRKRKSTANMVEIEKDEENDETPLEIIDWCCLPEQEMLSAETRTILNEAAEKLSPALRLVFQLRDVDGFSITDTAEILSISEDAVKTRLARARMKLRAELSAYFSEKWKEGSPMHNHENCSEYLKQISAYIDGELPPEVCAALEAHLRECENCRIVVDTMRKTIELYRMTSEEGSLPENIHDRLFARLNLVEKDSNG